MNKKELALSVSEKTGVPKKITEIVVEFTLREIINQLAEGNDVKLSGFGVFEVRSRKAKVCLNPRTKERMTLQPTKAPGFRPGKDLKDAVTK